jgi:3-isopropylmalate dehydrogenase
MAEASRALRKVARMHGFAVEDVHAPIGTEALTRSGQPLPPATRWAVLDADAVLVADAAEPALAEAAAQLDLRARLVQVLGRQTDVALLSPVDDDARRWTAERAFELAEHRHGRLVSVDHDPAWTALVTDVGSRHAMVAVEHAGLTDTVRSLALDPGRADAVVAPHLLAPALEQLAAGDEEDDRLAAVALLAENGPSVFAPTGTQSQDDAGHGVADPGSMLLAASLMLREGLGETHAADTLAGALRAARANGHRPAARLRTVGATTRDFGDAVAGLFAVTHRNAEFAREALA